MIKETILSRSVRLMFQGGVAVGLGVLAHTAMAQDSNIQRVEITGSAIKRINVEGALPVQTLTKAQIEQTGATTVADLVATLPAMQGFVTASTSINGGGGGVQTASVHGIGTSYTLVLLNGRRIAPYSSGSSVNLASIPLSAVERVEILTDGASALYGSDAIAGVVNFILKKNSQEFSIEGTYNRPSHGKAGDTSNIAITKGFGDYDTDGFNVLLAYSHDKESELNASDRSFSAPGGVHQFTEGGKQYSLYQTSGNSIPANVTVFDAANKTLANFNPGLINAGSCSATNTFKVKNTCRYNYAATVELLPELKRDGFFGNATVKINDNMRFFAEGLYSKFTSTARFAPPAQGLGIDSTFMKGSLYQNNIVPALVKLGVDPNKVDSGVMNIRLVDAGGRTDGWKTEAKHLALGLEGSNFGWDWTTAYVHSENKATDNAVAGYTSGDKLADLMAKGTYNPFIAPDANTKAALAPAVLHQELDTTISKLDVLNLRGSREVFKAGGGAAMLALGADVTKQKYVDDPSSIAMGPNSLQPNWTDTNVGGGTGALPIDASRKSWGSFAELVVPVVKGLEVTGDVRYDSYDAVKNKKNFDLAGNLVAPATQGEKASKATYKLAVAWRPVETTMLRASYGTGFKAPILTNITNPIVNGGSSGFHPCPVVNTPLSTLCRGDAPSFGAEYNLLTGGNSKTGDGALKPETSKQASMGFRIEPTKTVSIGFDLWDVKLKDQIATLPENEVFNNPAKYMNLFSSYYDPIEKRNVLAATLTPFNLATSHFRGIDWDHTFSTGTPIGKMTLNWTGTYMLKSDSQAIPGDSTTIVHSVGRFDEYNGVTFRLITKAMLTWKQSDSLQHSLTAVYHSGYHDAKITEDDGAIREVNADGTLGAYVGLERDVKSYTVWDWQTKYKFNKNFTITGGIKNLFNTEPPFSQRIAGGGNQLGYDGRYTDPLGRQFYLVGNYKF